MRLIDVSNADGNATDFAPNTYSYRNSYGVQRDLRNGREFLPGTAVTASNAKFRCIERSIIGETQCLIL